jgi:hypothetical protein
MRIYYTLRCESGRERRAISRRNPFNRPIDPNTGRFTFSDESNDDFSGVRTRRMVGFVAEKRIRGRFAAKIFDQQGPCWTGKGLDDPWVRFVAKRVTPPAGGKG